MATIAVYSKEAYTSHLELVKSVLQEMAILARSLEEAIQLKFKSSVDTLPKGTIHAILAFHHACASITWKKHELTALTVRNFGDSTTPSCCAEGTPGQTWLWTSNSFYDFQIPHQNLNSVCEQNAENSYLSFRKQPPW